MTYDTDTQEKKYHEPVWSLARPNYAVSTQRSETKMHMHMKAHEHTPGLNTAQHSDDLRPDQVLPFVLVGAEENRLKRKGGEKKEEEGRKGQCVCVRKPSSAVSTALSSSTSGCVKITDIDFDCNFKNSDCVKRGELYG